MNIFIDANVFLSFYHLTSDDLEELRKLTELLKSGTVRLHLPEQALHEYQRNRENKIAKALKDLKTQTLALIYPAMCKGYEQYEALRKTQKEYEVTHGKLMEKLTADINSHSLKADQVLEDLLEKGHLIDTTNQILLDARRRQAVKNPPGKNDSLGDAINWESLLSAVPDGEDIYVITDDGDFFSAIDDSRPKEFLLREWANRKGSKLTIYHRLSAFFKEHFPDIKLAEDVEKAIAVQSFVTSATFANTHLAVAGLQKFGNFDSTQVNAMAEAALSNDQIRWIITDPDVKSFLSKLVNDYSHVMHVDLAVELLTELNPAPASSDDDDIPF